LYSFLAFHFGEKPRPCTRTLLRIGKVKSARISLDLVLPLTGTVGLAIKPLSIFTHKSVDWREKNE